ncbi:hypothetical protein ACYF6T_21185 [Streptomyces sp. 7R007]
MKSPLSPQASGEGDLTPLLTAWDLAHPDPADPEWRHLLDELAHPRTTEAFHRLAETGGDAVPMTRLTRT